MTQRAKESSVRWDDACFELEGEWYLVPIFILRDFLSDWELSGARQYQRRADMLREWLSKNSHGWGSVTMLEIIFKGIAHELRSFILYN